MSTNLTTGCGSGLALSASTVKSWFQYRCERRTRYETMSGQDRDAIPILRDMGAAPWAQLGAAFESKVAERLAGEVSVLRPAIGEESLSQALSLAFLSGERSETYAHQLVLDPRPPLRQRLQLPQTVTVRRSFADLVRLTRHEADIELTPIDIKATQRATPFHKAQVAFYSLLIESLLADLGVAGRLADHGEIWTLEPGRNGEDGGWRVDTFRLAPYQRLVIDFFHHDVTLLADRVVSPVRDETFFHIYFKCEQCEYLRHCHRAIDLALAPASRDCSAVPGVSHEAKRALHGLGIHTVGQLAAARGLRHPNLTASWTLKRRAETLSARAQALIDGAPRRIPDLSTWLMPPRIDVGLYLVVDVDPVEDNLVALGYLRDGQDGPETLVEILADGSPQTERAAICRIMGRLLDDLTTIDLHNSTHEDRPDLQLQAHIYLYEPSEAAGLQQAVARHLEDAQIRNGLLHLVRLFPPEDLVPEPEFRGIHHLPATALRSVVEELYALPIQVSYDLRQVTQSLAHSPGGEGSMGAPYRPRPEFQRPFSSRLSIDICRGLRQGRFDPGLVESDVRARLTALRGLAHWLMARNREAAATPGDREFLRLKKRPFRFQATFNPLDALDLDLLQAFELLENRAGLLGTLVELAKPWRQRRDRARCIAGMTLNRWGRRGNGYWMSFDVPAESRDSDLSAANLDLILTDDDPDVRLDPQRWSEHEIQIQPPAVDYGAGRLLIRLSHEVFEGEAFQRLLRETGAGGWFIDRTFKDFTTERAARFIAYLGGAA